MNKNLIKYSNELELNKIAKEKSPHFDRNQKTILFIEPYGSTVSLVNRGFVNNFNIIILTADRDLRIVSNDLINKSKLAISVDTSDDHSVKEIALILNKIYKIDAVIPGFEYFVPLAAMISNLINVPGIACESVVNLRRKDIMRSILKNNNLNVPNYFLVTSADDLSEVKSLINFPAVCKPIDAAGSVNVKKVNNVDELMIASNRILNGNDVLWGYKLSNALLVEEYIDGKEYSLEGVINGRQISHVSITEKFVSDQTDFIEIGHIVNSPLEINLKQKIEQYVNEVINVLGATNCPFHAEIRIKSNGEPVLMEIAARLAGDKIGDLINLSSNINYFDFVYAAYLGQDLPKEEIICNYAGIRFFYRPNIEHYSIVKGVEEAKSSDVEDIMIYYKPNTVIPAFPKPLRRLGHVIAKSNNYTELLSLLGKIDSYIIFNS